MAHRKNAAPKGCLGCTNRDELLKLLMVECHKRDEAIRYLAAQLDKVHAVLPNRSREAMHMKERIRHLRAAGFKRPEIAKLFDMSLGSVDAYLYDKRKPKRKKTR